MSDKDEAYAPDEAEAAFVNSDNHALGELELQPYTPSRVVAAQRMGMVYPSIGDDAMEQFRKTGLYPGALQDVLILLWLLSLADEKEVLRALRRPDESLIKAIQWGADRGITKAGGDKFWAAYDKFIQVVSEANASEGVPKTDGGNAPGNE